MVANIVALGAISELIDGFDVEAIENAIKARIPQGTEEINMRAFNEGRKMIQESQKEK